MLESKSVEAEFALSEVLEEVEMEEQDDEEAEEQEKQKSVSNVKKYLQSQIKEMSKKNQATEAMQKILKAIDTKEQDVKRLKKSLKDKTKELEQKIEAKKQSFSIEEAQKLILQQLFDGIQKEMRRYLNAERKKIIGIFEKLWDKYQVSLVEIKQERDSAVSRLNEYLEKLGYSKKGSDL